MYNVIKSGREITTNQESGESEEKEKDKIVPKHLKKRLTISFSELSDFLHCPHKWDLLYRQGLRIKEPSIHTIFGTSIHNTIQNYLKVMYNESIKKADEIDFVEMLSDELHNNLKKEFGEKEITIEANELQEFYKDGLEILKYFKKKRHLYFPKKGYELVGVEVPINYNLIEFKNIKKKLNFVGFADIIIKHTNTNTYKIIDIKTSTKSWGKYKKNDKILRSQLVFYKIFFSKMMNVPINSIEIEYFIVKRKINENLEFPDKRIQLFEPSNGKTTQNEVLKWLKEIFLDNVYNPDATSLEDLIQTKTLPKIGGYKRSNCKFCVFRNDFKRCNKQGLVEEVNNIIEYNNRFNNRTKQEKN